MTAINTAINNNAYYQLSNPSGGTGLTGTTPNSTDALLQALSPTSTSDDSSAYLLDLSPAAQQYINGTGTASASSNTSPTDALLQALDGSSSSSSTDSLPGSTTGATGNFVLTAQQQQAITAIIAKYKDAPYTQDTFDQIQNDLNAAGLGTSTLSQKDQAENFNPTELFIDYLNGNFDAASAITNPDESGKSANYMQQIISQWKSISSTANTSAQTADGLAAAGGTGGA